MTAQKPREIAVRILQRRPRGADYTENLLEAEATALSPVDRGLAQELVYGVVRWQATLDWLIARKTEGRPQKETLRILLHVGLYQMFWLDRIPDHAAVNETVQLARELGLGPQAGFVNAVLRAYSRERGETRAALEDLKRSDPPTGWSHPAWLYGRWANRWAPESCQQLLEWNNTPPKTYARANLLRGDPGRLLEQWREEGVDYDFFRRDWTGENSVFELKAHPPFNTLPSFREGRFYLQDPSTLPAVDSLDPQPGETVLDFCAAPGGKAAHIAQRMENRGRLIAQDQQTPRLQLIRENFARLGVTCGETSKYDGAILPELNVHFDRILVDAPCSNTGVLRRRVDLRWRLRLEEIGRLSRLQGELLSDAAGILKPGGTLVYSTCSLEPEENREVIGAFLDAHPAFHLVRERELLPFQEGVDGAYVATLRSQVLERA